MKRVSKGLKLIFLLIGISLYIAFFVADFTHAEPSGVDVTNISTETYSSTPETRQDIGGTITTLTLDTTQQDSAWKGYVGNITGKLVLRNSDSYSIYEWTMNASSMSGYIFVSRSGDPTWTSLRCANSTVVDSEQAFFGMSSTASDNLNRTFNSTTHKAMSGSLSSPITASTCPSTSTYVNNTAQSMSESIPFQEILLTDTTNLIYGTFIDQNNWGYDNNASVNTTYDFQLIVAENRSGSVGTIYYFYADIY